MKEGKGKVYIAGAGPGDIGLLTLRCFEVLREADVILYDNLIPPEALKFAKEGAEKIYVGKKAGEHHKDQREINELMLRKVREGKVVLRLKGGDPFIFGRGGEECEFLEKHRVDFEVIPGVSSANAVPAYAGIPLTHRDEASGFVVVTGSGANNRAPKVDWEAVSRCGTIVVMMPLGKLEEVVSQLKKYLPPDTPCAMIENGTMPEQREVFSTLDKIVEDVRKAKVRSPALFVVGRVVARAVGWFRKKPLAGKKVLLTSPPDDDELFSLLKREGAKVLHEPAIKVVRGSEHIENTRKLVAYLSETAGTCVVFTSKRAVRFFLDEVDDVRVLAGHKIACVGKATAREFEKVKIKPDIVPTQFTTQALAKELSKLTPTAFVLARAEGIKNIEDELEKKAQVLRFEIYKLERARIDVSGIKDFSPDVVVFTSSLGVRYFCDALLDEGEDPRAFLSGRVCAVIGKPTAQTLLSVAGKEAEVVGENTFESLISNLVRFFSRSKTDEPSARKNLTDA